MDPSIRHLVPAVLVLGVLAAPLGATTYVAMTDQALADRSPLVVEGRIVGVAPAADAPHAATEYRLEVDRVLQGNLAAGTATVRVPGGIPREDGEWFHVWGAPRYRPGEEVLLFLVPRRDGSFGLSQLALGSFRVVRHGGDRWALRPEIVAHGAIGGEEHLRDLDAFADWLAARARGEEGSPDYFVAPPAGGLPALAERFSLIERDGKNFRWFEFDAGTTIDYRAHQAGQPGMNDGGFHEVAAGLLEWNRPPGSNVELRYRGKTSRNTRWSQCDGANLFLFDDPHDEIEGTFDCSTGGVVAIGGPCISGTRTFQGKEYWVISEGDVLTQDGAGCSFGRAGGNVGEFIFGHEVGHTLGIGHSEDPAALMVASVPSRASQGARLGSDDEVAIATLYPVGGGEEPDPDGWLTTAAVPGFRFRVEILGSPGAEPLVGAKENDCLAETLCVSAALPGRVEVQLRVVGPRPNGKLWPTFTKFTTSRVEIDVEQLSTGIVKSYVLEGASPGVDELPGLFDRDGFDP